MQGKFRYGWVYSPSQGVWSALTVENVRGDVYPVCPRLKGGYIGGCCLKELCLRQRIRVYALCHGLFGLNWSLSILWCGVAERDGDLCQGRRRKGSDRLRVLPAFWRLWCRHCVQTVRRDLRRRAAVLV